MSLKQPYHPSFYTRLTRPLLKFIARAIFRLLTDVHIHGVEHVPSQGAYIVAANHVSIYDPPFILAFWPHILETIGADVVFHRPGQGQLLQSTERSRFTVTDMIMSCWSGSSLCCARGEGS